MEKVAGSPDEYLRALRDDVRADIVALDAAISAAMPNRRRVLWEGTFWGGSSQTIIGYGDLRQPRPRGEAEWFIVGLARQKHYISVYVNAVEDNQYLVAQFADRLGKVKIGASSISFRRFTDIDLDALIALIERADCLCRADD